MHSCNDFISSSSKSVYCVSCHLGHKTLVSLWVGTALRSLLVHCPCSPVDVEDPNEGVWLSALCPQGPIEPADRPGEQLPVHVLGEGVPCLARLLPSHRLHKHLPGNRQPPVAQPVSHLRALHSQQLAEEMQGPVLRLPGNRGEELESVLSIHSHLLFLVWFLSVVLV